MSKIPWTDKTWNPVVGCSPVSAGCANCYAAREAYRFQHNPKVAAYQPRRVDVAGRDVTGTPGLQDEADRTIRVAEVVGGRSVFTGEVRCLPERLGQPLSWRQPAMVFVDSMSDLFWGTEEDLDRARKHGIPDPKPVPFEFVDRVLAIAALCPQHTFQIVTKRPERMAEYFTGRSEQAWEAVYEEAEGIVLADSTRSACGRMPTRWPLPNVWLLTSAENQAMFERRMPHLAKCPAVVRGLSIEPMLGPVDLSAWFNRGVCNKCGYCGLCTRGRHGELGHLRPSGRACGYGALPVRSIDWVIGGGESGPNARVCDVAWLRGLRDQCKAAGVPFFMKQLGAAPRESLLNAGEGIAQGWQAMGQRWESCVPDGESIRHALVELFLRDKKGGDPADWPADLRVREFPHRSETCATTGGGV